MRATKQFTLHFHRQCYHSEANITSQPKPTFIACIIFSFYLVSCYLFYFFSSKRVSIFALKASITSQVLSYLCYICLTLWTTSFYAFSYDGFQGYSLRNTKYIVEAVIFTGHETKISYLASISGHTRLYNNTIMV